jgi:hypothetical protein
MNPVHLAGGGRAGHTRMGRSDLSVAFDDPNDRKYGLDIALSFGSSPRRSSTRCDASLRAVVCPIAWAVPTTRVASQHAGKTVRPRISMRVPR